MRSQQTLCSPVRARGIGLHSGESVQMALLPAPPDAGIRFRRMDLPGEPEVQATAELVSDTNLNTALTQNQVRVATVEHLMSALAGMGVDNCVVELSAAEVPIMDGSAGPFVFLIKSVGLQAQATPRRFLRVRQPIQVSDGDKWARLEPYNGYRLNFIIDFDHPLMKNRKGQASLEFSAAAYEQEVSRARTFGFMREFEWLRARKLALGASLENAVAVDDFRVLNHEGLRYDDEFVRHKILDAVGDLNLLGHPLLASYTAFKSGHALNNQLARRLLAEQKAWDLVTFEDEPAKDQPTVAAPALRGPLIQLI